MTAPADQLRQFMKDGMEIRDALQIIEDAIIASGHDDYMVVTDKGSFHYMTVERARARAKEK